METAFECKNCGNIFPVVNTDMDGIREKDLSPYACPKCKSEDTSAALTSEEYLKSRSIVKSIR
jgi:Zn finger protein HypA/HybF involved in hydrogenase expression